MKTRVIIAAGELGGILFGYRKTFAVDGEPIIHRTVRLFNENGVKIFM